MNPMITVSVDERYVGIAANWLAAVRRLGLERHVMLVTLDPEAEQAFAAVHAPRLFRPLDSRGLGELWIHRVRILASLLAVGRDIVHSDADAVWLANPLDDLFPPGFGMVFSQGRYGRPTSSRGGAWSRVAACLPCVHHLAPAPSLHSSNAEWPSSKTIRS